MLHQCNNSRFSAPVVFRCKAQHAGNGSPPFQVLQRSCGTPQERPPGEYVSVHGLCCVSWQGGVAIAVEARLAMNADMLTETEIITLMEH